MYDLMFTYDTADTTGCYIETTFKGTWEEMMAFVGSHGLVKSLDVTRM